MIFDLHSEDDPSDALTIGSRSPMRLDWCELRHVSAERSALPQHLDVFALAKRQYRLQLRPDGVLVEATWTGAPPRIEEVDVLLTHDWHDRLHERSVES